MCRRLWLLSLSLLAAGSAWAQLHDPPSEADVRALIGQLHTEAAGHSSPDTRGRLEAQVAAATGRPERLRNAAGLILVMRGYPWEGLWFLTESAQTSLEQPDVLSNAGLLLTLMQRPLEAERLLLYTTRQWPDFDPAWTNLARLYCDTGEYDHAQECLNRGSAAQPGSTVREEIALRIAVEQRDSARAANHAVNVANLEPTSPLLRRVLPTIPEGDLAGALMARGAAVPLPESYVQLDDPLGNYEEFVLDELSRGYWNTAFGHFTGIGADASRQVIPQLPPEVFNRLPPDIQATLRAQGVGPGSPLEVLSPTASRAHYPRLNLHLLRYQRRYLYELSSAYRQGVVELVIEDLRQRTHEYSEQYAAAAKGGADPIGAMNAYCRNVIGAMNGSHARFLRALAFSREVGNRILREDWSAIAGLIALVPEPYRIDEVSYLRRLGALNSQYYSGCLVRWYSLGARAVLLDRMLADAAAEALHAGAAARELESIMARERREAALEAELEDGEGLELPIEQWVGLDLGVFAIKVIGDEEVEISGGEALVGEVSFNWEDLEFELGVGVGVAMPTVGPIGGEAKVLGVVRIGGPEEFGLGIHSSAEISAGTPVAGIEVDVIDDYLWIASAGNPDDAIIGSPWREP